MIDLDKHHAPITRFLTKTLVEFAAKHPSFRPKFLSIFCYPVDGFLTVALCSKTEPTGINGFNVGDFEFPETATYAPKAWYSEYWEKEEKALIRQSGIDYRPKAEGGGDEAYSQPFGLFLSKLLKSYFESNPTPFQPKWLGVQVNYFYLDCWRHSA
jgi:hypothetical protein